MVKKINLLQKLCVTSVIVMGVSSAFAQNESPPSQEVKPKKFAQPRFDEDDAIAANGSGGVQSNNREELPMPTADINSYPYGNLYQTYEDEFSAKKSAEQAERKNQKAKQSYEAQRAEVERELSEHRRMINEHRTNREQAETQLQLMEAEIKELTQKEKETEENLVQVGKKSEEILGLADDKKKELTTARTKLGQSLDQLRLLKERTQKNFYKAKMDIQRIESEIAILETDTQSVETELSRVQLEEVKARSEWHSMRNEIQRNQGEKNNALARLADAKEKLSVAMKDLGATRVELAAVEKDRAETERRVAAEVARVQDETASAMKAKTLAEVEKVKVDSEIDKLKIYGDAVKRTNRQALEDMRNGQYDLMESRLSLETFKTNMIKDSANGDKVKLKNEQSAIKQRQLASVVSGPSGAVSRAWSSSKGCSVYSRASSKSEVVAQVGPGQKVVATPYYGNWVKVEVAGTSGFSKTDCGQFDN